MVRKHRQTAETSFRVGVDTGGTFTDFVYAVDGEIHVFKVASTPDDPSRAITEGLRKIIEEHSAPVAVIEVIHGTTVGTNALLQRRGARVALVTTSGFEDVIEIGRQARPELYNLNAIKPPPLVAGDLRFGVSERVAASGEVIEPLTDGDVAGLLRRVRKGKPESIAISLLFSFAHVEHERRILQTLSELNVPLSVSHQILPEYREYERTSTVCVNAYLQPLMGKYLRRLSESAAVNALVQSEDPSPKTKVQRPSLSLRVMQSSGGSISAEAAAHEPVRTVLSGPAGGVVGALRVAQAARIEKIITFDMGGTSTDVALCDRDGMRLTNEAIVAGVPVAVPMMDIHTVGAGGGSIARVDEGGSLRVGPESAGADPGPASYGRSFLPTVTDAHVVLGHFPNASLLGGEFQLDNKRARQALESLAAGLSTAAQRKVSAVEAAQGVLDVVNTNMERALRHISVERGHDPRAFTLVPFGGAGGLHAVELARALQIPRVLLPFAPGALSAIGVLAADVVKEQSRTVMWEAGPDVTRKLDRVFRELEAEARSVLKSEGYPEPKQRHERSLAARYKGQSFELQIKQTSGSIAAAFHRVHRARYGYAQVKNVVEIVSARVRSIGVVEKLKTQRARVAANAVATPHDTVETYFGRKKVGAALYQREKLSAGARLHVPCIVAEYSATTLVPDGCGAGIDAGGNVIVKV
ncbi:MAG TPA: hydantoinase/oxoprolinase family protein [Pyrinomonadaceae bacterium]|nr:hydantoinase/oxoprolinase family protein [Pyrinomonadaceae bacterium]